MADDEKTMVEVEETESANKASGSLPIKKYAIYAGIVVVMVMAAWLVTLKVVKPMFSDTPAAGQTEPATEVDKTEAKESHAIEESAEEGQPEPEHGGEKASRSDGGIAMIRDIVVNPAGTGGTRFLSTSIGFELKSSRAASLFEEREAIVRDALITILSSQSVPQLNDFNQRERLRKLIQLRVQKLLDSQDIAGVYFTEFVLQ